MERVLNTVKAAFRLLLGMVLCQTGIALLFTYVANSTNVRGLGISALLLWIAVSVGAGLLFRRKLSPLLIVGIVFAAFVLSFIAYFFVGHFGLGWTGLLKGRNG